MRYAIVKYVRRSFVTFLPQIGIELSGIVCFCLFSIAQFAITINSNVCPHIRVPNMLMRNPMHDVIGIFNSEARY